MIDNKNLRIECESDINFNGRPGALKRSFQNVIQNGLTYGKSVNVNVQKSNNRVIIFIEDDGPGIPEDQYKNVFKPFFRLDKSRSLNKSGVGLGLAIVEDVINSPPCLKLTVPSTIICPRSRFLLTILPLAPVSTPVAV